MKKIAVALLLLSSTQLKANTLSLDEQLNFQFERSKEYLFDNLNHPGVARGAVIASPSRTSPDYFYHWVRDAALTMLTVLDLYETGQIKDPENLQTSLEAYVAFSRSNQESQALTGLGEPKFHVDGTPYIDPWGRPQNDGPALRAVALIRYANILIARGEELRVRRDFYDGMIPTNSLIKRDLEYVAHHHQDASFDIWEEVLGSHFYTLLVQNRALEMGAKLADRLGDRGAAQFYREQSKRIQTRLELFYDSNRGRIVTTIDRRGGIDYKASDLDVQTLLAVNHARGSDGVFPHSDARLLSTFIKIENVFANIYAINRRGHAALAIGRYPEDRYMGIHTQGEGNPWFLATLGMAEYLNLLGQEIERDGKIVVTTVSQAFYERVVGKAVACGTYSVGSAATTEILSAIRTLSVQYRGRALLHADNEGHMSEQINRNNGFMQGAGDLTWNYASFISATMTAAP